MSTDSKEQQNPQFYANLSQCTASVADIAITFGLSGTAPLGADVNGPMTDVVTVRLSAPAAKMLLLNLQQMVRLYEVRFAKIYIPKEYEDALHQGDILMGLSSDPNKEGPS
jgi:hypothetical protein